MSAEVYSPREVPPAANDDDAYSPSRLVDTPIKIKLQSVKALKEAEIYRKRVQTLNSKQQLAESHARNAWSSVYRVYDQKKSVDAYKKDFQQRKQETEREQCKVLEQRREARKAMRSSLKERQERILEQKRARVSQMNQEREYLKAYYYQARNYEQYVLYERSLFIKNDLANIQEYVLQKKFERANYARIQDLTEAVYLADRAAHQLDEMQELKRQETYAKCRIQEQIGKELEAKETLKMTIE